MYSVRGPYACQERMCVMHQSTFGGVLRHWCGRGGPLCYGLHEGVLVVVQEGHSSFQAW
jgi:hypothetical protein